MAVTAALMILLENNMIRLSIIKNHITRALAIMLSVATLITPVAAFASAANIKVSSEKIEVSDEVTVTVSIANSYEAKSGGVEITFDGSLAYMSGSAKFLVSGTTLDNYDESRNKGAFAFSDKESVSGDILTLKFKARYDGTPKITARVILKDGSTNVLEENVAATVTVGTGVVPSGAETTEAETTAAGDTSTEVAGAEGGTDNMVIAPAESGETYGDADNSIFRKADGSLNIGFIIVIIGAILIAITVIIVLKYNKKESKEDTEDNSEETNKDE